MRNGIFTASREYPLLYWTTFVFLVGLPNFVHFDSTGRTANALNLTSMGNIVLSVVAGYMLVLLVLLDRRPLIVRRLQIFTWLWIVLLIDLLFATAFEPRSRIAPATTMGSLLSLFRIGQWVVAFGLIVALYSRTPLERATELVVRLIGRVSWTWIAMVWLILPVMPSQVYGGGEDAGQETVRRLGGQLINPSHLAMLGSIAFFYALIFFPRGPRKWLGCLVAVPTIILTGARAQQAGFIVAFFLYAIVFSKKPAIRWGVIAAVTLTAFMAVPFSDKLMKYIGRGQTLQTLSTLDDRTRVWQASLEAIRSHPLLGYGYSVGARNAIRDYWKFTHWVPPHAHNEFLEAALDGGVIAFGIILFFYGIVFWKSLRAIDRGPCQLFLFLVIVQFAMNSLTATEFTYIYWGTSGILMLCCIGVLAGAARSSNSRPARRPWLPAHEDSRAALIT